MKSIKAKSILTKLFLVAFVFVSVAGWVNLALAQYEGPTVPFRTIIINAINWLVGIVAIVAILIIVFAGFQWAMASGDQEKVDTARKWLISAVTGLIIALAAWAIVNVVVTRFFIT